MITALRSSVLLTFVFVAVTTAAAAAGCTNPSVEDDVNDLSGEDVSALRSNPKARVSLRYAAHGNVVMDVKALPGTNKKVVVHYNDTDGTWKDVEAKLLRAQGEEDHELWYASNIPPRQFAIRYTVDGKDDWDNNSGKNYDGYKDPLGPGVELAVVDANVNQTGTTDRLVVEVLLGNHAKGKSKKVWIDYSLDGWRTKTRNAVSDQQFGNHWRGALFIPGLEQAKRVQFEVFGSQDDSVYGTWVSTNNNFGKRFECRLGAGSSAWTCSGDEIVMFDWDLNGGQGEWTPTPPIADLPPVL